VVLAIAIGLVLGIGWQIIGADDHGMMAHSAFGPSARRGGYSGTASASSVTASAIPVACTKREHHERTRKSLGRLT
jgi:hypothetical protein